MVPKFKTTEITPSETLGEKLKRIREGLKLTLDDVEKNTKIRKKYIKFLEANDYTSLPADVYVRGFLKTYSKILRIDYKKVTDMYEKERGIIDNIKQVKKPNNISPLKSPKVIITPRAIAISFVAIIAFIILGYLGYQILSFTASPKLLISSPEDNLTTKKTFIDISGKTDPGALIFVNGQKVNTSEEGDFKVTVSIGQKGVNIIKIESKNPKNGKITEKIKNVVAEIPEVAIKEGEQPKVVENVNIILKIGPGTCWVSVKKDGQKDFEGIMLPGTTKEFTANDNVSITTGNAGSTEVIFNGKGTGKLGNDGEVKTDIKFDKNTKIE